MNELTDEQRRALYRRAIFISLFSWRRAEDGDLPGEEDQRGWWGDSFPSFANDLTGSRLYLLQRRTITQQTLRDAKDYADEALQWLVDDGHAAQVSVTVERNAREAVRMLVEVDLLADDPLVLEIDDVWRVINAV